MNLGPPNPAPTPPRKILREIRSLQQDKKTKSHPIQGRSVQARHRHIVFFAVGRLQTPMMSAFPSSGSPSVTDHFQLQHPGIHSFLVMKRFSFVCVFSFLFSFFFFFFLWFLSILNYTFATNPCWSIALFHAIT